MKPTRTKRSEVLDSSKTIKKLALIALFGGGNVVSMDAAALYFQHLHLLETPTTLLSSELLRRPKKIPESNDLGYLG